ncbi:uncharacterized protein MONOS_4948 [Monocercomonoides exilis]|uniref:uncharacterized protein n=1 Tax=Monocercomonoides exilis TaxID=2049356 RepID=UPI0035596D19|nr:hypothetical protein MONOS_4948 [Monocercomonoides exilis]|eukprot:MONOS_4948.1-p1 / transcript=MONOS_4948.1 / gene=MONOS_4948 / organism=Monocercomonoides_exilis_PA203 / gene_product=unspecified product / transcript_product=unspecified product / location=Mono_scaffold00138:94647-95363(+) / protein_length=239 / sequence_SO=supercontig / SO=protein_coding / is_pseudo=false
MKDITIANSPESGITMSGGSVVIEKGKFLNNNPFNGKYPTHRRNIICSDSASLTISSLKGGDGVMTNCSLWIFNDGCDLRGIAGERASPFFIPVLKSVEAIEVGEEVEIVCKGKEMLPCDLSFMVVKQMGEEKQIEKDEFGESGYVSETEVEGGIPKERISEAEDEAEVKVSILFGDGNNPSSTDSFILKNNGETEPKGDEKVAEGEDKIEWCLFAFIGCIVVLVIFVGLFVVVVVFL